MQPKDWRVVAASLPRHDGGTAGCDLSPNRGSLKFEDIAQSMKSCYPDYVVEKKASGVHYLENEDDSWWDGYASQDAIPEEESGGERLRRHGAPPREAREHHGGAARRGLRGRGDGCCRGPGGNMEGPAVQFLSNGPSELKSEN